MEPATLHARAERLRLPVRTIARRSGLDEMTVHRIFNGKTDPRLSSLKAIEEVIAAEEAALLAELPGASPANNERAGSPPLSVGEASRPSADRGINSTSKIS